MDRRRWWRIGQWVIGAAIVIMAGRQLATNWSKLQAQPLDWSVRPAYIVGAILLTWTMYAALVQAWRALLRSWGASISWPTAARIWIVSGLGKYLPGKVWAIAGMVVMAQRVGVPPWIATGSAVVLQGLAVGAGGAVIAVTGFTAVDAIYPWLKPALLLIAGGSVVGFALLLWRPFMERLFRLVGAVPDHAVSPSPRVLFAALLVNGMAWIGYGVAFWLMAHGLLPNIHLDLTVAIGAFTASYLAGFLALIAPGGLVVRESMMILMLNGIVGPAAAAALAIASRIMLTFTEFGGAVPFVVRPGDPTRAVNSRRGSNPT